MLRILIAVATYCNQIGEIRELQPFGSVLSDIPMTFSFLYRITWSHYSDNSVVLAQRWKIKLWRGAERSTDNRELKERNKRCSNSSIFITLVIFTFVFLLPYFLTKRDLHWVRRPIMGERKNFFRNFKPSDRSRVAILKCNLGPHARITC
jgi:hypothetical protein